MNFSLSTSAPKKVPAREYTVQDLLNIQDELHLAWAVLTIEQKKIDEVQQIVDNVDFSMNAIAKYGNDAVKVLNADGSLEALLGIPEKMITAEKAMEGLTDAAKAAWEQFKEWIRRFWEAIKNMFGKMIAWFKSGAVGKKIDNIEEKIKTAVKGGQATEAFHLLQKNADATDIAEGCVIFKNEKAVNQVMQGLLALEDYLLAWNGSTMLLQDAKSLRADIKNGDVSKHSLDNLVKTNDDCVKDVFEILKKHDMAQAGLASLPIPKADINGVTVSCMPDINFGFVTLVVKNPDDKEQREMNRFDFQSMLPETAAARTFAQKALMLQKAVNTCTSVYKEMDAIAEEAQNVAPDQLVDIKRYVRVSITYVQNYQEILRSMMQCYVAFLNLLDKTVNVHVGWNQVANTTKDREEMK